MKDFKRVYTMFEGGDVKATGKPETFMPQQRVKIVRKVIAGDEDEEDKFEVAFTNYGHAIVDGCDLHPHPDAMATNVELFEHIANNGRTAMTQAFMIDAIGKVADAVVASADKVKADMEGTMISGDLWVETAKEIQAALKARS
jgi:hypothetical protein